MFPLTKEIFLLETTNIYLHNHSVSEKLCHGGGGGAMFTPSACSLNRGASYLARSVLTKLKTCFIDGHTYKQ